MYREEEMVSVTALGYDNIIPNNRKRNYDTEPPDVLREYDVVLTWHSQIPININHHGGLHGGHFKKYSIKGANLFADGFLTKDAASMIHYYQGVQMSQEDDTRRFKFVGISIELDVPEKLELELPGDFRNPTRILGFAILLGESARLPKCHIILNHSFDKKALHWKTIQTKSIELKMSEGKTDTTAKNETGGPPQDPQRNVYELFNALDEVARRKAFEDLQVVAQGKIQFQLEEAKKLQDRLQESEKSKRELENKVHKMESERIEKHLTKLTTFALPKTKHDLYAKMIQTGSDAEIEEIFDTLALAFGQGTKKEGEKTQDTAKVGEKRKPTADVFTTSKKNTSEQDAKPGSNLPSSTRVNTESFLLKIVQSGGLSDPKKRDEYSLTTLFGHILPPGANLLFETSKGK